MGILQLLKKNTVKTVIVKPESFKELLDLATDVLYSCPHGERFFTYDEMTKFLRMLEMKRVFIKVVDGNHQDCIDYLVSLGGKNRSNWRGTTCADSYYIDSKGGVGWVDESGWGWCAANGYTEVFLPEITHPKRHPHHDLIVRWASDPSQKVWGKQTNGEYVRLEYPSWMPKLDYYVGETPPANLEPVLFEDACKHTVYYIADPTKDCLYDLRWNFTEAETVLLDRKLVYSTPEGAIKRAKEMLGIED